MLEQFYHFNITVSQMDRSIAFYEALGFTLHHRVAPKGNDLTPHLGDRVDALEAAILTPSNGRQSPMLDLVMFVEPRGEGFPYATLDNAGIARVSFSVDDFDAALGYLRSLDVAFVGPDVTYPGPGRAMLRTVCFKDPDGTVLQIIGKA